MKCSKLQFLNVSKNRLSRMPECLRTCPIRQLNLSNNEITEVSSSVARLNLSQLLLNGNPIKRLPPFLASLRNKPCVVTVDLENLEFPDQSIASKGLAMTLDYLAFCLTGNHSTYRMKILVVGDPKSGKSSIVKALTRKWIKQGTQSAHSVPRFHSILFFHDFILSTC